MGAGARGREEFSGAVNPRSSCEQGPRRPDPTAGLAHPGELFAAERREAVWATTSDSAQANQGSSRFDFLVSDEDNGSLVNVGAIPVGAFIQNRAEGTALVNDHQVDAVPVQRCVPVFP